MADLERRRTVPFDRFLVALAIPEVGSATAKLLARHFASLDDLRDADADELEQLEGIGPEMTAAITSWFAEPARAQLIDRLFEGGVEIVYPDPDEHVSDSALAGKTLVFTGTLQELSRAEAKRLAQDLGARVASSLSKKTDHLVVGEGPGSKRKKAEELGVSVLDESDFLRLAGRG